MSTIDYSALINANINGTATEIAENRKLLEKAFTDEPTTYFDQFFTLLSKSEDPKVRKFCINNLLKNFSAFTLPEPFFSKLSKENITRFKSESFAILANETDFSLKLELSKFVGELSASITNSKKPNEANPWPEFTRLTLDLIKSDNIVSRIDGNRVLGHYFTYGDEDYASYADEIKGYVNKALSHSNSSLVHSGLVLLSGFVSTLDPKETKQFNEFTQKVLESFITYQKKEDQIKEAFHVDLREYIKECPKMFETALNKFIKEVESVLKDKKLSQEVKECVLDLFIGMNLQHPKKLEKSLKDTLSLIIQYFCDYSTEPDDEWKDPKTKSEEDTLEPIFRRCTTFFDMVLSSVNPEISLPVLKTQLQEAQKNKDWKKKAAALACLSQIGEYCEDIMQLNTFIQVALMLLEDEHPKVRYTVLHLLGQVAEDRSEEFAEKFHHIIGDISKRLNDPVPRVVSHVYACLTNIIEHCEEENLKPHVKKIFPACLKAVKEGPWHVRETAIPAISAFGESCKESIESYWEEASQLLLNIYETQLDELSTLTRAECIEALSLLAISVGKEKSKAVSDKLVDHMAVHLEAEAKELTKTDFRSYIFAAIPRHIQVFGSDYEANLDKLVPNLIKSAVNLQVEFFKLADAITEEDETATNLKDDLTLLLNALCELFKNYPKYMLQHLEAANYFAKSLLKDTVEDITEGAIDCFSAFFTAIKASGDEDKTIQALNEYLKILTDLFKTNKEAKILCAVADNTEQIVEAGGIHLKEQGVEELIEIILNAMADSQTRIELIQSETTAPEGEEDEEVEDLGDEGEEWDFQLACCTVFGKLYKAQPHACIIPAKKIFQVVIPQFIATDRNEQSQLVGVFLMVDLVESMGVNLMKNEFPKLTEGFCHFATHENHEIRQAALYGLGVIAKNSGEFFKTVGANIITAVINGIEKKIPEEEDEYGQSAKDNGISSLGKILNYQAENLAEYEKFFEIFMTNLPLKVDHQEGIETYGFLLDSIMGERAKLVFKADGSRLTKTLGMVADIIDTKFSNQEISDKIKKVLETLRGNESYADLIEKSIKKLKKDQQRKLNALRPSS